MTATTTGRARQRLRTRKDLLRAAARLMQEGRVPTLDEVAEQAMVSRATAYRYFSSADDLLREAALDIAVPDAEAVFAGAPDDDPVARVERVDRAFEAMIAENEVPLRLMLARSLERRAAEPGGAPARQNRRLPLIEAALEPASDGIDPALRERLARALSFFIGSEGFIAARDVLGLDEEEARTVRDWAIGALIAAATKSGE